MFMSRSHAVCSFQMVNWFLRNISVNRSQGHFYGTPCWHDWLIYCYFSCTWWVWHMFCSCCQSYSLLCPGWDGAAVMFPVRDSGHVYILSGAETRYQRFLPEILSRDFTIVSFPSACFDVHLEIFYWKIMMERPTLHSLINNIRHGDTGASCTLADHHHLAKWHNNATPRPWWRTTPCVPFTVATLVAQGSSLTSAAQFAASQTHLRVWWTPACVGRILFYTHFPMVRCKHDVSDFGVMIIVKSVNP